MERLKIDLPVSKVCVFEDRAKVTRTGTVSFPGNTVTLCITGVSPIIADATVSITVKQGSGVTVGSSTVRRFLKDRGERSSEDERIDREIRTREKELRELSDSFRMIDRSSEHLAGLLALTLREIPEDIAAGRAVDAKEKERWEAADDRLIALSLERYELESKIEDLHIAIDDLKTLQHTRWTPSTEYRAEIMVDLRSDTPSKGELQVEYLVPNACWRPRHRAIADGNALRFETEACVWQNTGEDWTDVALSFSTHRPSLGTDPPILQDDRIAISRKLKEDVVEFRDDVIEDAGLGGSFPAAGGSPEAPGVDDGGIVRLFTASSAAAVPSDGRPYRVAVGCTDAEIDWELLAVPEINPLAFFCSTQENTAGYPILAGPVDLVRDNEYIGRTRVLYVAPGERFQLGWGPDPEIRIHRSTSSYTREAGALSPWEETTHQVELRLSNLGKEEKSLELRERIPVSEIEKVRVKFESSESTDGAPAPDEDGIIRWRMSLDAFEKKNYVLVHTMEVHRKVVGV